MKYFHPILLVFSFISLSIDQALGTTGYGAPVVAVANSKDESSSGLNSLVPPTSSVALSAASLPDLSSDSAYNREIVTKHRAFRVYADQDFQLQCRDRINRKRRWHESTPDLEVGYNFTKYTVDRAHSILRDIENKQEITKGRYALGESFFWYYDPNRYRTVEDAVDTWYGEYRNYDYNRPGFSAKTGGFTQLVWKSSREVSCAKIDYETRNHFKTLLVCNYYPAGNVQAEFPYNVLPVRRSGGGGGGGGGGGNRPDEDDYPSRPSRPDRPNRPDRPSRPDNDRPSRPDYDPRPPNRPDNDRPNRPDRPSRPDNDRPSRPDYDPRPPNRPERPDYDPRPPSRPERPDYDPRPPSRPDRPRPPYDEDRPNRPGGGGGGGGSGSNGGGNYPTHPVLVSGSQTITSSGDKPLPLPPLSPPLVPNIQSASPAAPGASVEPTPVQYAPAVIAPQQVNSGASGGQVYEPVEAVLILPQQVGGGAGIPFNPQPTMA